MSETETGFSRNEELLRLVEINAYAVYMASLGAQSPYLHRLYERVRNPQIGDLVLEITTMGYTAHDGDRLGRLLRKVREPKFTPEQIEEFKAQGEDMDDPYFSQTEQIVYIQTPDGREFRWRNADFITVADEVRFFSHRRLFPETEKEEA